MAMSHKPSRLVSGWGSTGFTCCTHRVRRGTTARYCVPGDSAWGIWTVRRSRTVHIPHAEGVRGDADPCAPHWVTSTESGGVYSAATPRYTPHPDGGVEGLSPLKLPPEGLQKIAPPHCNRGLRKRCPLLLPALHHTSWGYYDHRIIASGNCQAASADCRP
jgi:hypothetical protein